MESRKFKLWAVMALVMLVSGMAAAWAQEKLDPFRDPKSGQWGYKRPNGSVAISPRFRGAGVFRAGHAPIADDEGFAMIDRTGRVIERFVTDSVSAAAGTVMPPSASCAWTASAPFPSEGLQCYIRQLRGSGPAIGGDIAIMPSRGESHRSAVVLKFPSGVVVLEDIGYEGFARKVLLPGVTGEQALEWQLTLYPDLPVKVGCSESWTTGLVPGGAFIEQRAGC